MGGKFEDMATEAKYEKSVRLMYITRAPAIIFGNTTGGGPREPQDAEYRGRPREREDRAVRLGHADEEAPIVRLKTQDQGVRGRENDSGAHR